MAALDELGGILTVGLEMQSTALASTDQLLKNKIAGLVNEIGPTLQDTKAFGRNDILGGRTASRRAPVLKDQQLVGAALRGSRDGSFTKYMLYKAQSWATQR